MISQSRIDAFKDALLNTCVCIYKTINPESTLTLSTCKKDSVFCQGAYRCLDLPLFREEIEPAMGIARYELSLELYGLSK